MKGWVETSTLKAFRLIRGHGFELKSDSPDASAPRHSQISGYKLEYILFAKERKKNEFILFRVGEFIEKRFFEI